MAQIPRQVNMILGFFKIIKNIADNKNITTASKAWAFNRFNKASLGVKKITEPTKIMDRMMLPSTHRIANSFWIDFKSEVDYWMRR